MDACCVRQKSRLGDWTSTYFFPQDFSLGLLHVAHSGGVWLPVGLVRNRFGNLAKVCPKSGQSLFKICSVVSTIGPEVGFELERRSKFGTSFRSRRSRSEKVQKVPEGPGPKVPKVPEKNSDAADHHSIKRSPRTFVTCLLLIHPTDHD